jgi:hypothetical protein
MMIKVIQEKHITKIVSAADALLAHLKQNETFISSSNREERIGTTTDLFRITRLIKGNDRFQSIKSPALATFKKLTNNLTKTLSSDGLFQLFKLADYTKPDIIKVKICRELISELDNLYVLGQITDKDIKEVYSILDKPVPKRFNIVVLNSTGKKLSVAISKAIKPEAEYIKQNTIKYYADLANLIGQNCSAEEFIKLAFKKLSDLSAIRLCFAYKFRQEHFNKIINEEFNNLITYTSFKIAERCVDAEPKKVKVTGLDLGAKGFDISITVNEQNLYARAIPVEGCYTRFHYRYIIT